ncbi:hypothetical protein GALL_454010 [mine drainage metagenome]|uniref:Single Cache domain-containing protein n=1 Tax=mine drainage metagenome TaxID=410659 RepID=A0A1J5PN87_9ZZZZ
MQMNRRFSNLLIAGVPALMFAGMAVAAGQGTPAEAEALANKAVAFLKANGPEKAAAEFTNGKSFKDRDLYVVYEKFDGTMLANGGNAKLVGKNLAEFKDADGKLFNKMLVETAKTKGKGWSESYKFINPVTQKIGDKIMYVERVDDAWIGVGVYK